MNLLYEIKQLHESIQSYDLICFSHLRWDFVYQRPQHLMSRFANQCRTFFIEEPVYREGSDKCEIRQAEKNLWIVVPYMPPNLSEEEKNERLHALIQDLFLAYSINNYIFWYYTPMSLKFSEGFSPKLTVYDCMDELSAFKFAPPELTGLEKELFKKADVVFTGGVCLYEHKKNCHHNIYPFPSSIDKEHFVKARTINEDPHDQREIPGPRFGFYGVVDERFDIELLDAVSTQRPDWHFIILGPVVKIDPAILPRKENIHYLGGKTYDQLPDYLSGWDIAFIPFARNESTRFISPTKTPEYLAAGRPVISTSIRDVVDPYGHNGLVEIADDASTFIEAAEKQLHTQNREEWLNEVDAFLSGNSWNKTWNSMLQLINIALQEKYSINTQKTKEAYV